MGESNNSHKLDFFLFLRFLFELVGVEALAKSLSFACFLLEEVFGVSLDVAVLFDAELAAPSAAFLFFGQGFGAFLDVAALVVSELPESSGVIFLFEEVVGAFSDVPARFFAELG